MSTGPARRARRGFLAGPVGGLLLLLAACGSTGTPQPSATASSASSSPASSSPASSSRVSSSPAGSPSSGASSARSLSGSALPGGAPTTLQGTVTEGVENGCVVLVDGAGAVLANLQGWDLRAHPFDSQVEVTGAFEPDLMTTCQQGTPFDATSVVSK